MYLEYLEMFSFMFFLVLFSLGGHHIESRTIHHQPFKTDPGLTNYLISDIQQLKKLSDVESFDLNGKPTSNQNGDDLNGEGKLHEILLNSKIAQLFHFMLKDQNTIGKQLAKRNLNYGKIMGEEGVYEALPDLNHLTAGQRAEIDVAIEHNFINLLKRVYAITARSRYG